MADVDAVVFQPASTPVLKSPPDLAPSFGTAERHFVPPAVAKRPRDLRIDFFRGLALVGIAVNHTAPPPAMFHAFGHYQFGHVFSFNFADVFVFVSGFVCAIAYASTLRDGGWWGAQKKALGRCRSIYGMYWLALGGTVALVWAIRSVAGEADVIEAMRFDPLALADGRTFLAALLMRPPYTHFGILEFYVVMLTLMPGALWLYGRKPWLAAGSSLGLYVYAQAAHVAGLPGLVVTHGPFGNYLAWQLLFFGGLFLGAESRRGRLPRPSAGQVVGLVCVLIAADYLRQTRWMYYRLDEKEPLGPLRVVELLAVVGIISRCIPADAEFLRRGMAGWIARAGKHGLGVFAWTLVSAYFLTDCAALLGLGRPGYMIVAGVAAGSAIACGLVLDALAKAKRAWGEASTDASTQAANRGATLSRRFDRAA